MRIQGLRVRLPPRTQNYKPEECKSGLFGQSRKPSESQDSQRFESSLLRHVINFSKKFKRGWNVEILEKISYVPPVISQRNLNVATETFKSEGFISSCLLSMFYYVYILQSLKNKSLYIGYSGDLKKRINQHNNGESPATKPFTPYKLIYYEAFLDKADAKNREEYLKSGYGRRSISKMLYKYLK